MPCMFAPSGMTRGVKEILMFICRLCLKVRLNLALVIDNLNTQIVYFLFGPTPRKFDGRMRFINIVQKFDEFLFTTCPNHEDAINIPPL